MRASYNELLEAIYKGSDDTTFDIKAINVYRSNLHASACRSMSISFPVLEKLVGIDMFARFSRDYLEYERFNLGDWAAWGGLFPRFLLEQQVIHEFPYLSDIAKLEWALHCTEREEDEAVDDQSFSRLNGGDVLSLRLAISSHLKIIKSDYPILDIVSAHGTKDPETHMRTAKSRLNLNEGQNVIVSRPHLKSMMDAADDDYCDLLGLFLEGRSIGDSLERLGDDFEFEKWLMEAVQKNHVIGIV